MRIIAKPILINYWEEHRQEKSSLERWYNVVRKANWEKPDDIKKTFNSVDPYTKNNRLYHIFDVGGNNTRVIVNIHFKSKIVFIQLVLTHNEYDQDRWKESL